MDVEQHEWIDDEKPRCLASGWCCGCDEHPIGKPWGWNYLAWEEHYQTVHQARITQVDDAA